jgi:hypothetical protein
MPVDMLAPSSTLEAQMDVIPASPKTLLLPEELDDARTAGGLAPGDGDALRAVAAWITDFVARPHEDLGRQGPVCPFVPAALARHTLWLAPEHVGQRSSQEVAELVMSYQALFKDAPPHDGDDATYKSSSWFSRTCRRIMPVRSLRTCLGASPCRHMSRTGS